MRRGLAVFADGLQAAFTAGAVAELARRGRQWQVAVGAGLGAQVAVLGVLGEGEEAGRRWQRQGEHGCPLLVPLVEEAQRRLRGVEGAMAWLDPWRLGGWLDPAALEEHLAPEAAGLPGRLSQRNAQAWVATVELEEGRADWEGLNGSPSRAVEVLGATCLFPAGWGALPKGGERRWGGVGVLALLTPQVFCEAEAWDVVCGFPLPPVPRPWLSGSLWEQLQRRDEIGAALTLARWVGAATPGGWQVVAPTVDGWRRAEGREEAELGVEYPLPWERNGELAGRLVAAGAAAVAALLGEAC